ncbi:hypothetical protein Btru_009210 [Bulinus truncatus]|nr:hypothetical protein Btru_009210 [Bulinus truncatus]
MCDAAHFCDLINTCLFRQGIRIGNRIEVVFVLLEKALFVRSNFLSIGRIQMWMDVNDVVKLTDASFSWDFFPDEYVYDGQRERYLPLRWMAPESLSDGYYDKRTDVWSLAVLIWELMTRGCLPFQEVPDANVKQYIVGGYILGKPDTLLDPMYELMCQCWSPENECRPSIGEITRRLGEIIETDDDVYENLVSYSNSPKHIPVELGIKCKPVKEGETSNITFFWDKAQDVLVDRNDSTIVTCDTQSGCHSHSGHFTIIAVKKVTNYDNVSEVIVSLNTTLRDFVAVKWDIYRDGQLNHSMTWSCPVYGKVAVHML